MTKFSLPVKEIEFIYFDVLKMDAHYKKLGMEMCEDNDLIRSIFSEAAKFSENEIAPLNAVGDEQGCELDNDRVRTPQGFKEVYEKFVDAGWPSIAQDETYGGQNFPLSVGVVLSEMIGTASWAWAMYTGLSQGAMRTIYQHGTDNQKQTYLSKMTSGEWTGTMCLTEPHCGTDLGLLRTKAVPNGDGSYSIKGDKIFISSGDHDLTENIVHIVLARLPDAPEGVRGISLFIVPKNKVTDDGEVGESNNVQCLSLEKKMGIHGNATAAIHFDGSRAELIGEPNKGLRCMFTFMNTARIGTSLQGVCHSQRAYHDSLAYARDRLQMRSLSGTKSPSQIADPIIVHPDVRRMLLTQKTITEGGRAFCYFLAQQADILERGSCAEESAKADRMLGILTPVGKAFLTEYGLECASLGMQCFGGHGYIREHGMEQNLRDARISTLYEGTTGIQALDLLGRKVALDKGRALREFTSMIRSSCRSLAVDSDTRAMSRKVRRMAWQLDWLTVRMLIKSNKNVDNIGAASFDFLMYCGLLSLAWMWLRIATTDAADKDQHNALRREEKLQCARFYFERILPRADSHRQAMLSGCENLMDIQDQQFDLGA